MIGASLSQRDHRERMQTPMHCGTREQLSRSIARCSTRLGPSIYSLLTRCGGNITVPRSNGIKAHAPAAPTKRRALKYGAAKGGQGRAEIPVTWGFSTPLIWAIRISGCLDSIKRKQAARRIVTRITRKRLTMVNERIWRTLAASARGPG